MDKYYEWLDRGLKELFEDYFHETFVPLKESDIKCHLYHTLLQTKSGINGLSKNHLVLSEIQGPTRKRSQFVDLAIGHLKSDARKGKLKFEPRLLIEIKKTGKENLTGEKLKQLGKDIDKLRRYKEWLQKEGREDALNKLRPSVVLLFFGKADQLGLREKPILFLKQIQDNYKDIRFLWGPKYS